MELTGIKVARNQRADADRARLAEVRAARAEAAKERAAKQVRLFLSRPHKPTSSLLRLLPPHAPHVVSLLVHDKK